jgi:4'-phosphopantetheinyl transferase
MDAPAHWQPAPAGQPPAPDEVQVWRILLDQDAETIQRLGGLLSPDEVERANRFFFEQLRVRYTAARGALRQLAGAFLSTAPAAVEFSYALHGKPHLAGQTLKFNLSHSHQYALIAFSRGREVGVDIEQIKHLTDADQIARRFFSPREVDDFLRTPAETRHLAFFNCWTRKEAYIKAIGDGLTFPLDQFRVTVTPGEPARLLEVRPDPHEAKRWKLESLEPGEQYRGAVIAEGQDWRLTLWDYRFAN